MRNIGFQVDSTHNKDTPPQTMSVAHQAPLSMGFSRQEYWSGLPFPYLGDLLNPRIEPGSPALQADSLPSDPPGKPHVYNTPHKMKTVHSKH